MTAVDDPVWVAGHAPDIDAGLVPDILSRVADVTFVLSGAAEIRAVLCHPAFKGRDQVARLQGRALRDTLTPESAEKFDARLAEFRDHGTLDRSVELNHAADDGFDLLPMRYSFQSLGDTGEMLLLGRDLSPIAQMQQQLIAAQITLEKDYEARRAFDTQFRVLMASVSDAMLFISLPDGRVTDSNPAARSLLGKQGGDLNGLTLDHLFVGGDKEPVADRLATSAAGTKDAAVSLKAQASGRMVAITPTLFRAGGEQGMLCRVVGAKAAVPKVDTLSDHLLGLYEKGADAIAFVSPDGAILSVNEAFHDLADITQGQAVKGRSLAEFLSRGGVDLNVMLENANRSGTMRAYTTRIVGAFGSERAVEIATTHLRAGSAPIFALVMRDVSRLEAGRNETAQLGEVDTQSVIELIGNQPLRDIVASTTDVVEKMCIETAVELTSNNRVAAAEMLGLSRQSLYVKLRKYGLLKTGTNG
ncbi:transcriptional regulator PpsR [Sulfitobacter albidus]|uniref:Transcriptional regulator PpsR n=1 Tax=Sulfitobacter albidus TaxID=2829501 RepID=A0A975JH36_9RHOB|nr:transcriptional regulator PpsR [Sulfitobacter albidus]QUJ78427.1 transcriptional regulator PpsR [Sulfitobacter albidus]